MVPSIIDVWGYDREFIFFFFFLDSNNKKTEKHKVMKFCKNVDIHGSMGMIILICLYVIKLSVNNKTNSPRQYIIMGTHEAV